MLRLAEYLRLCTIVNQQLAFGFKMLITTEEDLELSLDSIIEACGRPVNNNNVFLDLFKTHFVMNTDMRI